MVRYVVAAALILPVVLSAQGGTSTPLNPFANDPYWTFSVGADRQRELRRQASSADPVEAITANFAIGAKLGAVRAARGLLSASPDQLAKGLRLLIERSHDLNDDGTTLRGEFLAFVADARRRVETLSGEDGAEAASAMVTIEHILDFGNDAAHKQRVDAFLARYAGTKAAAVMRVSRVEGNRFDQDFDGRLRRYRELAREYDGADAAAMALYLLGFRLANPALPGPDPTARILEIFEIVKRLESDRFPRSRWTENPAQLVHGIYFDVRTDIPPASMTVLYAKYLEFVLAHPSIRPRTADPEGLDWIICNSVGRLASTPVERVAVVERFLDDLEKRGFGRNRVSLLRARFYLSLTNPGWISDHLKGAVELKDADARAIKVLREIARTADVETAARASAMLGEHLFATGRYADARTHYRDLASRYPAAEWNWVAAFHVAQIHERLKSKNAAGDYEALASRRGLSPGGMLLARMSAAELRETQGDLPAARAHYQVALDSWGPLPERINVFAPVASAELEEPVFKRFHDVQKSEVTARLQRLSNVFSTEEGLRRLLRRARFSDLLTNPPNDRAQLDRTLDDLARGPYDTVTTLSKLAKAAIRARRNAGAEAETMTLPAQRLRVSGDHASVRDRFKRRSDQNG